MNLSMTKSIFNIFNIAKLPSISYYEVFKILINTVNISLNVAAQHGC